MNIRSTEVVCGDQDSSERSVAFCSAAVVVLPEVWEKRLL